MNGIVMRDQNKLQKLIRFAIPAIIESLLVVLLIQVDTYLVSDLGTAAVASIALTVQPIKFLMVVFTGICTAITKCVAEAVGRRDQREANAVARYGFLLTLGLSIVICTVGVLLSDGIIYACGSNAETHADAVDYFRIVLMGFIPQNLALYINAVKRGCQNSRVSLVSNVIGNIVNVVFDLALIDGLFGFPALGIRGAAIATAIGYLAAFLTSASALFKSKDAVSWKGIWGRRNPCNPTARKGFLTLSGALCLEFLLTKLGFLLISVMTAKIGTTELAMDRVAMPLLDIVFSFGSGIQAAALTIVGHSIGQNCKKDMLEYADTSIKLGMWVAVVLSALFAIFGSTLILLFFEDGQIYSEYASFISGVSAMIVLAQIPQLVLNGILRGAGMGKYTLIISVISVLLLQVVGDFVLIYVLDLGLLGKWIGSLSAQVVWVLLLLKKYASLKKEFRENQKISE